MITWFKGDDLSTVAYDGKMLAGDRMCVFGGTPIQFEKVRRLYGWVTVGCVGGASDALLFMDWVGAGRTPESKPELEDNFCAIVLEGNGDAWVFGSQLVAIPIDPNKPWAIGSGGDFAMGAMAMGADAEQAVEIASKYDIYTGLGVDVIEL